MQYTLDDTENAEITQAVQAAYSHLGPQPQALDRALLASRHDRDWPLWMALCHAVIVQGRFHQQGHLPALVQQLGDEAGLSFTPAVGLGLDEASSQAPLSPARVAGLAAGLAHPGSPSALQPDCLQDDLVLRLFEGQWPPAAGALDLTQMLVSAWQGAHDSGRVARLELWLLPADNLQRPGDHGALVRAPGAALLPVDTDFAEGLDRVQRLLRQVLRPGAPAVAWNLRPLPLRDLPHPPPLPGIAGPSATAALAYGALYLLRQHLQPAHAALADSLLDTAPANIAITAGLDGPLGGAEADNTPWHWPRLVRVGGIDHKLGALQRTLPPRQAAWRYVAHDQHASAQALAAGKPLGLDDLVVGIRQDCGGGLDADARHLHRLLVQDDAPITDSALLARVASSRARPASVKAYLLWRYARRASGSHQAFGDPVRLDQHYIRLVLKAPSPQGDEPDDADTAGPDSMAADEDFTLDHLLSTPPHDQAAAWCVESAPFTGKTTLLAEREARTARRALQSHQRQAGWGEVCVFLPMRAFKRRPPLPPLASLSQQAAVLDAFVSFVHTHAPGLPQLPQLLAGGGNAAGLQCRLLVDGLNELPAASLDERRAVMALICTWMHGHRQHLLPPVFSVRELENGLDLASDDDPRWRARRALLQPWRRTDWVTYIALRQLPPQAQQRLHTALRLHLPDAHGHADDTPFEQFCRSPGILAAQCTLLRRWAALQPPEREAQLFLALLWHCLAERGSRLPDWLLPKALRGEAALQVASQRGWRLPAQPGSLIEQLGQQADAMQDAHDQPLIEVPMAQVPPGLQGEQATAWREAVATLGLAAENFDGQFVFIHQQWLAFFAALGCGSQRDLPDLAPPPLHPPPGPALLQHLAIKGNRLELPPVTPHHERMRFAAALSASPEAWLRRLLPLNLALAAQVALDHRHSLEPGADGPWPGEGRPGPHPVLQHIRRLLLLRSVDAGASVRASLHAAGVLGPDAGSAALAEHMPGFDTALQAHWQQAWQAAACQGEGVDLRDRLQAGLLLGELGDNLRYELVSVVQPDGSLRKGLRPKASQWASLGHFEIAKAPVTVAEWTWFVAGGGYDDPAAPWWQQAGPDAQRWLRGRAKGRRLAPWFWGRADRRNPLQAVAGISAHEALAYAAWAQDLHPDMPGWRLQVPSEPMWEAGVGGAWAGPAGPARTLDFNHHATRYWRPSPVGVFSRSHAALGLADTAGNVREWCVNAPESLERQALRGGSCGHAAIRCSPAYRNHEPPGGGGYDSGLRLARCVLSHSEP